MQNLLSNKSKRIRAQEILEAWNYNQPHEFAKMLGRQKLTEIHSKWIKLIFDNDKPYVLQAHRNSYKTTAIAIGIVWRLIVDPERTFLYCRKSRTDAQSVIREVRQYLESDGIRLLFRDLHGVDDIRGPIWGEERFTISAKKRITKEPSVECVGLGGAITGKHPDHIIGDDLATIEDRVSKAEREWTRLFVGELFNLPNRPHGKVDLIGTPWHPDDLFRDRPPDDRFPIGSTGIEFTEAEIEGFKKQGRSLYAANYELVHVSDENRIFKDQKEIDTWPKCRRVIGYLDPAYEGDNTTALTILGDDHIQARWIVAGYVWRQNVVTLYSEIVNRMKAHGAGSLTVETNADQGAAVRDLQQIYPAVSGRRESDNKHVRILSEILHEWDKIYFIKGIQPEYMNQILDYQEGQEPDDAPDSLAGALRQLNGGGGGGIALGRHNA